MINFLIKLGNTVMERQVMPHLHLACNVFKEPVDCPLLYFRLTAVRRWPQSYGFRGSEAFMILYKTIKRFFKIVNRNPLARHIVRALHNPRHGHRSEVVRWSCSKLKFSVEMLPNNRSASARKIHGLRTTFGDCATTSYTDQRPG